MNYYKAQNLLQRLAILIDLDKATHLETEAFNLILETLNEQDKAKSASSSTIDEYRARNGFTGTAQDPAC